MREPIKIQRKQGVLEALRRVVRMTCVSGATCEPEASSAIDGIPNNARRSERQTTIERGNRVSFPRWGGGGSSKLARGSEA